MFIDIFYLIIIFWILYFIFRHVSVGRNAMYLHERFLCVLVPPDEPARLQHELDNSRQGRFLPSLLQGNDAGQILLSHLKVCIPYYFTLYFFLYSTLYSILYSFFSIPFSTLWFILFLCLSYHAKFTMRSLIRSNRPLQQALPLIFPLSIVF